MKKFFMLGAVIFILGWLSGTYIPKLINIDQPFDFSQTSTDLNSPHDFIKEDQIQIYESRIVLNISNARWVKFSDTNSMDPVIDQDSNAIEIVPESTTEIRVGDIISYKTSKGTIIHRVVQINKDEEGWYAITKGDNTNAVDPYKVRFEQIKGVVVGIIY